MFMPFHVLDNIRNEAHSALPHAPVVEHIPKRTRKPGALRRGLANALYALARKVEGQRTKPAPSVELCPTELAH